MNNSLTTQANIPADYQLGMNVILAPDAAAARDEVEMLKEKGVEVIYLNKSIHFTMNYPSSGNGKTYVAAIDTWNAALKEQGVTSFAYHGFLEGKS